MEVKTRQTSWKFVSERIPSKYRVKSARGPPEMTVSVTHYFLTPNPLFYGSACELTRLDFPGALTKAQVEEDSVAVKGDEVGVLRPRAKSVKPQGQRCGGCESCCSHVEVASRTIRARMRKYPVFLLAGLHVSCNAGARKHLSFELT